MNARKYSSDPESLDAAARDVDVDALDDIDAGMEQDAKTVIGAADPIDCGALDADVDADVDADADANVDGDAEADTDTGARGLEARVDPDLDIVRLAQERSSRRVAMGILYERFRDRVYNVALRIVGNGDEAADVLQDVFVLLFRKIHRFRARAVFASWVYRITVNVSLDHLRRRRRAPTPTTARVVLDGPQEQSTGSLSIPERTAANRDLEEHVRIALGALSDRLRIVIVLRYLEGLAYADIAEILDCSIGTVKSRLNRAHAAMRDELTDLYDSEAMRA